MSYRDMPPAHVAPNCQAQWFDADAERFHRCERGTADHATHRCECGETNGAICRECLESKHAACDGTAWDHERDDVTECTCTHEQPKRLTNSEAWSLVLQLREQALDAEQVMGADGGWTVVVKGHR